jgi:hypothetical protein
LSWIEYINSPQLERNDDGFYHATRMFKTWNYARAAILGSPTNVLNSANVPMLMSDTLSENMIEIPFGPDETALRLYAYDIRLTPYSLISEVEVRYTNDIRLLSKPFAGNELGRAPKGRAGAFNGMRDTIPIGLRVTTQIDPTTFTAIRTGWEERPMAVPVTRGRLSYSLLVPESNFFTYRDVAEGFANKIVRFQTSFVPPVTYAFYLFEGLDYSYHSPGFMMVTLFFQSDRGIRTLDIDDDPNRKVPPSDKEWAGEPGVDYVRPPFTELVMLRDSEGDPVWQAIGWYAIEYTAADYLTGGVDRP